MTLLLYVLCAVPSLKVMQSGMAIFDLLENSITPKDIGSRLKMCLAGPKRDYASSIHMTPFTLRCLLMIIIPTSSRRFALELTAANEKGGRFIPRSSKYLLYAYHLLQGADDDRCSNVSIDKWVKFWSKKAIKYHLLPPRKRRKQFNLNQLITLLVILQLTRGGQLLRRPCSRSYASKGISRRKFT
ncbi:UNVERIFIED_CONTAM: hypothetical protein Sradi_3168400 [Sesamum radiatum]|uniref:Uncharacterized protein n=1 Tax=Sesamum radiatum TaxID=300843 RepID=A0AAW2RF62_SESRA